ncbi:MAG: S9 family peptidase [Bacteroidetes bacterium]|nr:MAG: S9 family peptidase [Bacteroidota bacterium]
MRRTLLRTSLAISLLFSGSAFAQQPITLEDVWMFKFYAGSPEAFEAMPDGEHYTMIQNSRISGRSIEQYDFATGNPAGTILTQKQVSEAAGEDVRFTQYSFSADQTKVLLAANVESIYRHSTRANYYMYDLTNSSVSKVGEGKVRYATFSPDGSKVAYVQENNLYVLTLANNEVTQVTTDGEQNSIINGATDWVYEEEFAFPCAFWWSPNSEYIAFLRFDETEVPEFSMDVYGTDLYPTQDVFKYPKAGEANSVVTAHIFDTKNGTTTAVLQDEVEYEYIPRIIWNNENEAVIFTTNRHQNELVLWEVDCEEDYESERFLTDTDEAYVEISDNFMFTKDNDLIFTSERDGYNHIYLANEDGKVKKQLTKGDWDVLVVYGTDDEHVYFQAAAEDPSEHEVYRVRLNGRDMERLSTGEGIADAQFSPTMKYYLLSFENVTTPTIYTMHSADGTELRTLEDNADLAQRMENYQYVPKEFFNFETSEGVDLNGWMIKPYDFDEEKEYPVLMFVYGGPGSQQVLNNWDAINGMYYQYLASLGYIVACVDNRGTGARGSEFKKVTYQQLGKYETIDQIEAAKYLGGLDYIDSERIGIWGWSYGGYMSSNCITQGHETFKMAIAVAPVTNWRFYDSIYTERYMRTPQENGDGYDDNSPINHVGKLEGAYLLVHGSADDNVHVQNTMRMIESLVQANKQFDLFIYPDKNHGIYGGNTRYHLYTKMTNFILENL